MLTQVRIAVTSCIRRYRYKSHKYSFATVETLKFRINNVVGTSSYEEIAGTKVQVHTANPAVHPKQQQFPANPQETATPTTESLLQIF